MADNEMADRIKRLRKEQGLTLEQVAQKVGVGKSTVRKWEVGMIENMRRDKIASLAKALNTTPAYLMGWEEKSQSLPNLPANLIPLKKVSYVPLIGKIACGTPIFAEENIINHVMLPEDVHANFALRCEGDSMIGAGIDDGDIVYLRQQPEVENGEIAAVRIGDTATLKKVEWYPDKNLLILRAQNPDFKDLIYSGADLEDVEVIGKAVAVLHWVNNPTLARGV